MPFSVQDYIDYSYFLTKVTIYKIDEFSNLNPYLRYDYELESSRPQPAQPIGPTQPALATVGGHTTLAPPLGCEQQASGSGGPRLAIF